jgi:NADPH2:quinone reductase
MKAWILDALDGIEKMRLGELPDPKAGANEVVLRMKYAALNPADRYLAQAQYPARPPLPHVLGRDGLGVVEQVGSDVTGHRVGDVRVVLRGEAGVTQRGLFAERVAVNSEWLVTPPAGWTEEQAASAPLVYVTAYQALTQWGELQNAVVLVTGASGGVGVASIQMGSALGHSMIGLSRSSDKSKILLNQGASACFQPQDEQWRQMLYEFLGHRRIDLAIDNIGGPLLPQVIETLAHSGRVSTVGMLAGPVPQFNTAKLFFRRLRIGGVAIGTYTNAESRTAWDQIVAALERTNRRPLVDHVYPFENLPDAFARLAEGPMGKILISGPGSA